ncbi:MAG: hypothetical protein NVS1B4_20350 [Gemmatimonadaceae bacterium]
MATSHRFFIHELAFVTGDVTVGDRASIWPFAVVRGDRAAIIIGRESNVQDGAVLHVDPGLPCTLGDRVAIGHRAVVHGATIGSDALVGIGAIVLNGAVVGSGSIIGAGALVTEGAQIPPGSLVIGVPGRVVRSVRDDERGRIARTVAAYVELQERYRRGEFPRSTAGARPG